MNSDPGISSDLRDLLAIAPSAVGHLRCPEVWKIKAAPDFQAQKASLKIHPFFTPWVAMGNRTNFSMGKSMKKWILMEILMELMDVDGNFTPKISGNMGLFSLN